MNGGSAGDFEIYVNGISTNTAILGFNYDSLPNENEASSTVLIATVNDTNTVKLGVHSLAIKDTDTIRQKYQEVWVDRETTIANFAAEKKVYTRVEKVSGTGTPLRYILRSNPVKIKEKR